MNCPVTIQDVTIAEKFFRKDIGALKGKTTRKTPGVVKDDEVEIPQEIKEQNAYITLCMDNMFVNNMPMFTSIDKMIRYRCLVALDNRSSAEMYKALDKTFRLYNYAGYKIKTLRCDAEFKVIMDKVADDLNIRMNYTATNEHVPEAERNNRTIGEHIRATYHNLP